jgi:hypothetical protein
MTLTTSLLLLCAYGLISGYREGMIMIMFGDENFVLKQPQGVRGHRYFNVYHILDISNMVLLLSVGYILSSTDPSIRNLLIVGGALFLTWQLREASYNFSRYGRFIEEEHLVFLDLWDKYLTINQTIILHIGRVLIGAVLIAGGLYV